MRINLEELVVLSFPGPDRSIKMEDMRAGRAVSRRYRNRRIGEFLKDLELTEGRSTGISKILKSMKANGSPLPKFESDEDRTHFLVRLPIHERSVQEVTSHSQVSPQVERLLAAVEGELLRDALQERLAITDRKYFRTHF